jgi:hypothetical protein
MMDMGEDVYRQELQKEKREMQITLIRETHPVYAGFNFSAYSDRKVEEMYRVLVIEGSQGGKDTEVQTNV